MLQHPGLSPKELKAYREVGACWVGVRRAGVEVHLDCKGSTMLVAYGGWAPGWQAAAHVACACCCSAATSIVSKAQLHPASRLMVLI